MESSAELLDDRLRPILLAAWDPHNVTGKQAWLTEPPRHQYDFVLPGLRALLATGATEEAVMAFLAEQEAGTMCFPSIGRERLRRPARLLIAAFAEPASPKSDR